MYSGVYIYYVHGNVNTRASIVLIMISVIVCVNIYNTHNIYITLTLPLNPICRHKGTTSVVIPMSAPTKLGFSTPSGPVDTRMWVISRRELLVMYRR